MYRDSNEATDRTEVAYCATGIGIYRAPGLILLTFSLAISLISNRNGGSLMSKNSGDGKPEPLGHFEQLVLSAVTSLRGNAYGVTIHAKVSELAGRSVNLG